MKPIKIFLVAGLLLSVFYKDIKAQQPVNTTQSLNGKQQSIVTISGLTAKGDLEKLSKALNDGLDAGLTVNQIKEVLVHIYAYAGFPRSIRGLQTFMTILSERKSKGINDVIGAEASLIKENGNRYKRGKDMLEKLTGVPQSVTQTGYSAFAPVIDTFLKEHLFADMFERDVLGYAERELVTISVITAIGGAEPMLQGHLNISLHVGLTSEQLQHFVKVIKSTVGKKEAKSAQEVLDGVLKNAKPWNS